MDAHGLGQHTEAIRILDRFEPGEFDSPLGHICGAAAGRRRDNPSHSVTNQPCFGKSSERMPSDHKRIA